MLVQCISMRNHGSYTVYANWHHIKGYEEELTGRVQVSI